MCSSDLTSSLLLFANSGMYHISSSRLSHHISVTLQSFDHSNIFLLIAGTYTSLSVALLSPGTAALVLGIVWGGAVLGIVKCLVWRSAPLQRTLGMWRRFQTLPRTKRHL